MKIAKRSASFLRDGDTITVAVTHEVKIGGDSSWIRYEASSKINQETSEDAATRVIGHVNEGVMQAVTDTVETVRKAVNK